MARQTSGNSANADTEPGRAGEGVRRAQRWAAAFLGLLATLATTFVGLTLITFVIGRVIPIDPVAAVVGDRAPAEVYERVRIELGLHLPLYQQYFSYLSNVVTGDLGTSVLTGRPVLDDLLRVFPATLELATIAIIVGVAFGVPMGVVAATHQRRWPDHIIRVVSLIGYSVPIFWLGMVGLLILYSKLGIVGGPGRLDIFYEGIVPPVTGIVIVDSLIAGDMEVMMNAVSHIILPASLLGYLSLAFISRMTRSLMVGELGKEYVLTARVKGVSHSSIIWEHALGNIMVPLITVIALSYGLLLEGAVLTETVFSWPGLGLYIKNSLFNADMNAVLGGTVLVGAVFVGLNMFCDLLYKIVDPRAL